MQLPATAEQLVQTSGPAARSAGVQAPSVQPPSLNSPGVQVRGLPGRHWKCWCRSEGKGPVCTAGGLAEELLTLPAPSAESCCFSCFGAGL